MVKVSKTQARLVPMNEEHLEATLKWLSDPALRKQVDCLNPPTAEGNTRYWRAHWNDKKRENYAILNSSGKHVGNCGLYGIDLLRRKAELWIYLGEEQGAGSGSEAVKTLLSHAFNELKLNRVYVRVLANNSNALSFFRSLGFAEEGRLRQDTCQDGTFIDSLWLSLLKEEHALS